MSALTCGVLLVCVLVVLFCYLAYWLPRKRLWGLAKKMPGPAALPLIGNAILFWGSLCQSFDIFATLHEQYGPVLRLWLGNQLSVMLLNPDDIGKVLGNPKIRNRNKSMTDVAEPFMNSGLLINRDEIWKTHRRIITPLFHFKILETYVEIFQQKAAILVEKLEELSDGRTFDIYDKLSLCTLDAICETAIGCPVETQKGGRSEFRDCIALVRELLVNRFLHPWLMLDWLYPYTSDGRKGVKMMQTVDQFSSGIVNKKLSEYRQGIRNTRSITTASGKTISSFLDLMVEASETEGSSLSAHEIQDEVTTMAAGGLETTASTMSFFLLLVAIHPDVQESIWQEMDEIFGEDERAATNEDLARMSCLDRAVKETLRMFPIVGLLSRDIDEDVELPSGYTLPKDSKLIINLYVLHRQGISFPEPNRFWPDRWLPENITQESRHPYAYLPFGAGARNCVGQKYAFSQMKTVLSTVLRRFKVATRLTMEDLRRVELSVSLALDGKYDIQLEKRIRQ